MDTKKIIYLGFNSFLEHKRGVENVIDFQSSLLNDYVYYIHWGNNLKVYRYKHMVCVSIPYNSFWKFLILSFVIRNIIKKNKNRVRIHSHNPLMSIFLFNKTNLLTVHDGLYYQNKEKKVSIHKRAIFYVMEKILYKKCNWVHFISNYTKSQSLFPSSNNNYTIIYNSSNIETISKNYIPNESLFDRKYPYLDKHKYCFTIRSIEERARIDLILSVAQKRTDTIFVIAGKGPLLNSMIEYKERNKINNVHFLGYIPDEELYLLYYYSELIMVSAEHGEGFGLPIIEGYLFNKPVIASNKCAIHEVIINNQYLFENTIDSIIEKIDFSRNNSIQNPSFYEYYNTKFSHAIIKEQYYNLYGSLL